MRGAGHRRRNWIKKTRLFPRPSRCLCCTWSIYSWA